MPSGATGLAGSAARTRRNGKDRQQRRRVDHAASALLRQRSLPVAEIRQELGGEAQQAIERARAKPRDGMFPASVLRSAERILAETLNGGRQAFPDNPACTLEMGAPALLRPSLFWIEQHYGLRNLQPDRPCGVCVKQGSVKRKLVLVIQCDLTSWRNIPKHNEFLMCGIVVNLKRLRHG